MLVAANLVRWKKKESPRRLEVRTFSLRFPLRHRNTLQAFVTQDMETADVGTVDMECNANMPIPRRSTGGLMA